MYRGGPPLPATLSPAQQDFGVVATDGGLHTRTATLATPAATAVDFAVALDVAAGAAAAGGQFRV
jgi:hypothetical protein